MSAHRHPEPAEPTPATDTPNSPRGYEPPTIKVLGTLAQLTQGQGINGTDFLGLGSQ
jgi:hypothetical protein